MVSAISEAVGKGFDFFGKFGEKTRIKLSNSFEGFKNFFPEQKDNSLLIIIGVLAALIAIVLIFTKKQS